MAAESTDSNSGWSIGGMASRGSTRPIPSSSSPRSMLVNLQLVGHGAVAWPTSGSSAVRASRNSSSSAVDLVLVVVSGRGSVTVKDGGDAQWGGRPTRWIGRWGRISDTFRC